jgi:hypothetical protein
MQALYRKEKDIIEKAVKSGNVDGKGRVLKSAKEVNQLAKSLSDLKHYGKNFSEQMSVIKKTRLGHAVYKEKAMIYNQPEGIQDRSRTSGKKERKQSHNGMFNRGLNWFKNTNLI